MLLLNTPKYRSWAFRRLLMLSTTIWTDTRAETVESMCSPFQHSSQVMELPSFTQHAPQFPPCIIMSAAHVCFAELLLLLLCLMMRLAWLNMLILMSVGTFSLVEIFDTLWKRRTPEKVNLWLVWVSLQSNQVNNVKIIWKYLAVPNMYFYVENYAQL